MSELEQKLLMSFMRVIPFLDPRDPWTKILVKFREERNPYRVQAVSEFAPWVVCSKPFAPKKTVLYTILDLRRMIRGPENLILGFGAETPEQCQEMIKRLESGETEVSRRHCCSLNIERVSIILSTKENPDGQ